MAEKPPSKGLSQERLKEIQQRRHEADPRDAMAAYQLLRYDVQELLLEVLRLRAGLEVLADPAEASRLGGEFRRFGSAGAGILMSSVRRHALEVLGRSEEPPAGRGEGR